MFDPIKARFASSCSRKGINAKLELTRADSAIKNVESALDADKPSNEVDSRIDFAKEKLDKANDAFNSL